MLRCSAEHMVRPTPARWSTCWASKGCGAGAPGHRQSVRLICMLGACHVPGLWADLTRHVIALKICKAEESCGPDNKAAASLGHMLCPPPPKKRGAGRRKPWRPTASRLYCSSQDPAEARAQLSSNLNKPG